MGDDGGKSPQEGVGDVKQTLERHLPAIVKYITDQYGTAGEAEVGLAEKYSPRIAKLQADLLGGEGSRLAATGRDLSAAEARQAAATEADIAEGPGQRTAAAAVKAQQMADPEYYKSRGAISDSLAKLLDFDPTKLSKGEEEGIARGLGRTASYVPSAAETAKSALVFGKAGEERRNQFSNIISNAANASNALRGPVDASAATARRQVLPNVGTANYTGVVTPGLQTANAIGSGTMGTANAAMQVNMGKEIGEWDKINKGMSAGGAAIGSIIKAIAAF